MSNVAQRQSVKKLTSLADKGYHTGKQIEICKQANITTIVAQPGQGKSNENGTTKDYLATRFRYDKTTDTTLVHKAKHYKVQEADIRKLLVCISRLFHPYYYCFFFQLLLQLHSLFVFNIVMELSN